MAVNQEALNFLEQAKTAVHQLDTLKSDVRSMESRNKKLDKNLNAEKKAVAESITAAIKKRRGEINDGFDAQISATQDQIKKVKQKRDEAKTAAMNARIEQETAGNVEHGAQLKSELKALFANNKVPSWCNSRFFYALSSPRGIVDILILILTLAVCFFAIPVGLYKLIGNGQTFILIILYVACILVFGGLYFLLINRVRFQHHDTLEQGRKMRARIRENDKQISDIKSGIKNDANESMYNLGAFDQDLARLDAEKQGIEEKKRAALDEFDMAGAAEIRREITANNQERLDALAAEFDAAEQELDGLQSQVKELSVRITENYESVLGSDYLKPKKIDSIGEYLKTGQAATISEACELFRNRVEVGAPQPEPEAPAWEAPEMPQPEAPVWEAPEVPQPEGPEMPEVPEGPELVLPDTADETKQEP